jgi:hypothetical protein
LKKSAAIFLLFMTLAASTVDLEKKIYGRIFRELFPNLQTIQIYTDDDRKWPLFKQLPQRIVRVPSPENADILMLFHEENLPYEKPVFIGKYYLLHHYKNRAIGGFYWKKGRPHILFFAPNLAKFGFKPTPAMHEYLENLP